MAAAEKKSASPKKPCAAPPPPPQKIVKTKKSSPPAIPEPTYATLNKRDISLPLPPTEQPAQKPYASSMADLNTCGLPDTEMLRRTSSMRNPPPYRHTHPDLPEHVLENTGARTRANLNQLLTQDIQQIRDAARAGGLNEAWEADTRV